MGEGRAQGLDIAMLHIGRLDTRPFGAGQERVACSRAQTGYVESAPRDKKLRALACLQIITDRHQRIGPIWEEHEHIEWITEIMVVQLIRADTMQRDLSVGCDQEVEG